MPKFWHSSCTVKHSPLELVHQQRGALRATALMTDGVLDFDLVEHGAVVELDEERVADGALLGVVVVDAELLVLDTVDLGAECVNAGIGSSGVGAVECVSERTWWVGRRDALGLGGEFTKDQRVGDHVVDGMAMGKDALSVH